MRVDVEGERSSSSRVRSSRGGIPIDVSTLGWREDEEHHHQLAATSASPSARGRERRRRHRRERRHPPDLPESVLVSILRNVAGMLGGGIPSVLAAGAVCRSRAPRLPFTVPPKTPFFERTTRINTLTKPRANVAVPCTEVGDTRPTRPTSGAISSSRASGTPTSRSTARMPARRADGWPCPRVLPISTCARVGGGP